jgi:hypothetical protein
LVASYVDWPEERKLAEARFSSSMKEIVRLLLEDKRGRDVIRVIRYIGDTLDRAI